MIFELSDTQYFHANAIHSLRQQLRPIISLRVAGPSGRMVSVDAVVDTGADEVLLPNTLLPTLGFTPGAGTPRGTSGIGGRTTIVFHPVRLEIRTAPNDCIAWHSTVGFSQLPYLALFGVAGGLEFFHTTLNVIDRQLGLFPHPTIPLAAPCVSPHVAFSVP